jgi:hypothetical protein
MDPCVDYEEQCSDGSLARDLVGDEDEEDEDEDEEDVDDDAAHPDHDSDDSGREMKKRGSFGMPFGHRLISMQRCSPSHLLCPRSFTASG